MNDTIIVSLLGGQVVMTSKQIEAMVQLAAKLEQERDELKVRVDELENTIDCASNALTDSICCSGNDADTNLGFVRKLKNVLRPKMYKNENNKLDVFWCCAAAMVKIETLQLESSDMREIVLCLKKYFQPNGREARKAATMNPVRDELRRMNEREK